METKKDVYDSMINELSSSEKIKLIHELLLKADEAHIDIDNGSNQVIALGILAQAKRIMQRLEDDYINMGI